MWGTKFQRSAFVHMIAKWKEYKILKKLTVCLATILLLLLITISAQAEENNNYKGDFTALAGNSSMLQSSYQLTDKLRFDGDVGEMGKYLEDKNGGQKDYFFRTDLHYQITDWIGVKIGGRYDSNRNVSDQNTSDKSDTMPYGEFDFLTPFGTNGLKFTGYYNYNYEGKDWANYEFAWRFEVYENQYIYTGVRGDSGKGFKPIDYYDYNQDNDPLFFIRGDFNGQWGKWGLKFRPLLFATGYILTDTTLKYKLSDRNNVVLNISDYYDRDLKYRLGFEHKF
jgi:hypothetical protein